MFMQYRGLVHVIVPGTHLVLALVIYDLEVESDEPSAEERRQIRPASLYNAYDGRLITLLGWFWY